MLVRALFYTRPRADFLELVAPSDGAARRRTADLRMRYLFTTTRLPERMIGPDFYDYADVMRIWSGWMVDPDITMSALLH
jgi:hypothetical protein